jgi:putative nucleotidyltransferase with HDIG domain
MTNRPDILTGHESEAAVKAVTAPPLIEQVLELMRDPASSVSQLGAVVATDRDLSERIIQRANSPTLALPSRVETVSEALTLLGFEALRDTLMRMVVSGALRTVVNLFSHYEQFWRHSIACGLAARLLARKHGLAQPTDAFVAGLFHDLGLILPEGTTDASLRSVLQNPQHATSPENHEQAGAEMVERWGLGKRIVEAVRCHHTPATAVIDPALTATVHVADVLCHRIEIGRYGADRVSSIEPAALALLGLTEEDLVVERLTEETALLKRDLEEAPSFDRLVSVLRSSLVEAVGKLPYQERLAMALCYQEGLTMGEVAKLMGVTEPEARQVHDNALGRLASIIHDCV